MTKYDLWTVRQFLEGELESVRQLHSKTNDLLLLNVIEYLEKRLSGDIQ